MKIIVHVCVCTSGGQKTTYRSGLSVSITRRNFIMVSRLVWFEHSTVQHLFGMLYHLVEIYMPPKEVDLFFIRMLWGDLWEYFPPCALNALFGTLRSIKLNRLLHWEGFFRVGVICSLLTSFEISERD